jgi:hypothetical protein
VAGVVCCLSVCILTPVLLGVGVAGKISKDLCLWVSRGLFAVGTMLKLDTDLIVHI